MPASRVVSILHEALWAMGIGIPGVFAVLTVFYIVLKALMSRRWKEDS